MFKLVADGTSDARQQWIPGWVDMLSVWKSFQAYDQVSDETMVRVESCSCSCILSFVLKCLLPLPAYAERESSGRRTDSVGNPAIDT
jgi:hypothetical protein